MNPESTPKLCECGCGQPTTKPTNRFISGHHRRKFHTAQIVPDDYEVRGMGYETECWVWVNCLSKKGYGFLNRGGESSAHRVSYMQHRGEIAIGLTVDHLCRITACVNPWHMELVPIRENILRSPRCKVTKELYEEIFRLRDEGLSYRKIGRLLNISSSTVWETHTGSLWAHYKPTDLA